MLQIRTLGGCWEELVEVALALGFGKKIMGRKPPPRHPERGDPDGVRWLGWLVGLWVAYFFFRLATFRAVEVPNGLSAA